LDELYPAFDITKQVTASRVAQACELLKSNEEHVMFLYEKLAHILSSDFHLDLKLEWQLSDSKPNDIIE